MVGNDIVDLLDPESRPESLHPRFDTRVFSEAERAAIAACESPNRERWRLWAAKEAAYKLVRKSAPTTVFSPVRFEVSFHESVPGALREGKVSHGDSEIAVRAEESQTWVHVIALGSHKRDLVARVAPLDPAEAAKGDPDAPSHAVRALVCEAMAAPLGVHHTALEVRRTGRVPHLYCNGELAPADLSLSHHGGYVAFAAALLPSSGPLRPGAPSLGAVG